MMGSKLASLLVRNCRVSGCPVSGSIVREGRSIGCALATSNLHSSAESRPSTTTRADVRPSRGRVRPRAHRRAPVCWAHTVPKQRFGTVRAGSGATQCCASCARSCIAASTFAVQPSPRASRSASNNAASTSPRDAACSSNCRQRCWSAGSGLRPKWIAAARNAGGNPAFSAASTRALSRWSRGTRTPPTEISASI